MDTPLQISASGSGAVTIADAVGLQTAARGFLREWRAWLLGALLLLLAFDLLQHLFNFPIRLVLLRLEVYLAEWAWLKLR